MVSVAFVAIFGEVAEASVDELLTGEGGRAVEVWKEVLLQARAVGSIPVGVVPPVDALCDVRFVEWSAAAEVEPLCLVTTDAGDASDGLRIEGDADLARAAAVERLPRWGVG